MNNYWVNNLADYKNTLLHEVNHFIEGYERYNKNSVGANDNNITINEYRNNLGEIISNETKILADLTQEKLDSIMLPIQAKENPTYNDIKDALNLSNKLDRRLPNAIRNNGKITSNQKYNQTQMVKKTTRKK